MLSVFQIVVPTPYPVGPVNIYLIKSDPITLIDVGPDTKKAANAISRMLNSLGVEINDIKRIIITHAHPDHSGLAAELAGASGATICIHPLELRKMDNTTDFLRERIPYAIEAGVPQEVMIEMYGERDKLPRPKVDNCKVREITEEYQLDFDSGCIKVLHLPGHSPGHICLWDYDQKNFFSGDFLLPHITPNPVIEFDPDNPAQRLPTLKQYLNGLDRVDSLDIKMVCPGHGGVFSDYKSAINTARIHHEHQFKTIINKLRGRELSSYELSKEVYPNLQGWDIFLGISEIQAHLDLLIEQGQVKLYKREGIVFYYNA